MLLATGTQCALWHPDGGADFREMQWLISPFGEKLLEPRENRSMVRFGDVTWAVLSIGDSCHHCVHQSLLQRPSHFGLHKQVGRASGKMSRGLMQVLQP
jgi:hypothetical protein